MTTPAPDHDATDAIDRTYPIDPTVGTDATDLPLPTDHLDVDSAPVASSASEVPPPPIDAVAAGSDDDDPRRHHPSTPGWQAPTARSSADDHAAATTAAAAPPPAPRAVELPSFPPAHELLEHALFEVKRVVVGQDGLIERLFVCAVAGGHCLLEGPPGLAKTLAAKTLATVLGGGYARVQFTPDLVPADVVGTRIYRPSRETFDIEIGPVFANVVLADEINRAAPKVQSALLEVMAERHVTIGGQSLAVPDPFIVLATQNPIESEGVYALPEAQRDRFLMKVLVDYPSDREEAEIVRRVGVHTPVATPVLDPDSWRHVQRQASEVFVHDAVLDYAVRLVAATRRPQAHGVGELAPFLAFGVSPRATLGLVAAARALALMRRRRYALPRDVFDVAPDVLRHRLVLTYEAMASEVTAEQIVRRIVGTVWAPIVTPSQNGELFVETAVSEPAGSASTAAGAGGRT